MQIAVVYQGPASNYACTYVVSKALRERFEVRIVGPSITDILKSLEDATLYVQPGGGDDLNEAWMAIKDLADPLRLWVEKGGHYIGICMGAYLSCEFPPCGSAYFLVTQRNNTLIDRNLK